MNSPLTHLPTYVGVWAVLCLGIACNLMVNLRAFAFTPALVIFAVACAITLLVGWRQQGIESESGRKARKITTVCGAIATLIVLLPMFGMPLAGVYVMALLQLAENCVMVTRRHVYRALLISAGMVIFACMQYRANWTLFIYLLPYVVAVTFTLVASQISQRMQNVRVLASGAASKRAQGMAMASATATILAAGLLIYSISPQVTWPFMKQQVQILSGEGPLSFEQFEETSTSPLGRVLGNLAKRLPWTKWPDEDEVVAVLQDAELPEWQKELIESVATAGRQAITAVSEATKSLSDALTDLRDWMKKNKALVAKILLALLIAALLLGFLVLFREGRPLLWLRTKFDYWYLVRLRRFTASRQSAQVFFCATERLMALRVLEREPDWTARQYAARIAAMSRPDTPVMSVITKEFELARYGTAAVTAESIERMCQAYAQLVRNGGLWKQ